MIEKFLRRVISDGEAHIRWLNTLSYLEYVGARKIIKSQHEQDIDEALLEHMAEEIHHAHLLKKIIRRIFHRHGTNFSENCLLAKGGAKKYIQTIDAICAKKAHSVRHTYLLSSYVIESRALLLYATYEELLQERKLFRLTSILKQEHRHLMDIKTALIQMDSTFLTMEDELRSHEEACFNDFLISLNEDLNQHDASTH